MTSRRVPCARVPAGLATASGTRDALLQKDNGPLVEDIPLRQAMIIVTTVGAHRTAPSVRTSPARRRGHHRNVLCGHLRRSAHKPQGADVLR